MTLHTSITDKRSIKAFILFKENSCKPTISYVNAIYVNMKTKMNLCCKICNTSFMQNPDSHKKKGCPVCAIKVNSDRTRCSTEEFISKAIIAHGNTYDYSKVAYINNSSKVIIICPIHGEFEQVASAHIGINASGCYKCSKETPKRQSTLHEFIEKAHSKHNLFYSYYKAVYVNSLQKVIITCPVHGDFEQTPGNHLAGQGCPICNAAIYNVQTKVLFYYIKVLFKEKTYYKVGLTRKSLKERYSSKELSLITLLYTREFSTGSEAYEFEQSLLNRYKHLQYRGPNILHSGNTELFIADISNEFLINKEI